MTAKKQQPERDTDTKAPPADADPSAGNAPAARDERDARIAELEKQLAASRLDTTREQQRADLAERERTAMQEVASEAMQRADVEAQARADAMPAPSPNEFPGYYWSLEEGFDDPGQPGALKNVLCNSEDDLTRLQRLDTSRVWTNDPARLAAPAA